MLVQLCFLPAAMAQDSVGKKSTVITSEHLSFDYKRLIAIFEGNVVVVDARFRMESDRMNVLFNDDNEIRSVTSSGNVRIFHDGKIATCKRAIYVAHEGQVIMRGDVKLKQGNDLVEGDEVTMWLNEDRMVVKPARLVIQGDRGSGRSNPLKGLQRKSRKNTDDPRSPSRGTGR